MGDLEEGRHRSHAAAERASLVAVPALQAEAILACHFFTEDLLDGTQAYVLAVIEHASRRIRILGVTLHPLAWNQAHLQRILRAYEIHHNQHRPHRSLDAAAPLKPYPNRSISTGTASEGRLTPDA